MLSYGPGEGLARASDREDLPDVTLEDLIARTPELSERDVLVLRRRAEGKTLQEVGAELGLSRERIRQLEVKIFRLVREANDIDVEDRAA